MNIKNPLVITALFFAAQGCAPDPNNCIAQCHDFSTGLVAYGMHRDGSSVTKETVCEDPAIQDAKDCGECFLAISETYSVLAHGLACHCIDEATAEYPGMQTNILLGEECMTEEVTLNEENCTIRDEQAERRESCFP